MAQGGIELAERGIGACHAVIRDRVIRIQRGGAVSPGPGDGLVAKLRLHGCAKGKGTSVVRMGGNFRLESFKAASRRRIHVSVTAQGPVGGDGKAERQEIARLDLRRAL